MHVAPEKIHRKAVFQAIQASEDTKGFQERLRDLAIELHGNMDKGYLPAHEFLAWLDQETKLCQVGYSESFFERHPTLGTVIPYLAPIATALGGIAALVVEILSQ